MSHEKYMRIALALAYRGLGQTWPNPSVGCVIVKNGVILSRGRTAKNGRPHAEQAALNIAGKEAKNATAYVTLEPCSHHGKTPPCAEALIKSGIKTVVVSCKDPDPRVSGNGIEMLKRAGLEVIFGVGERDALELNKGFFKRIKTGLPWVTLKVAVSADGKFLEGKGQPQWVTCELARNYVHKLRAQNDAIITGTGTVLADNPKLNVRLSGLEDCSPIPVVIGNRMLPTNLKGGITDKKIQAELRCYSNNENLKFILKDLGNKGFTRVMIESGPTLANAFLNANLVDEIIIIQAPTKLKKKGTKYFEEKSLAVFRRISEREMGDDLIIKLLPSIPLSHGRQ